MTLRKVISIKSIKWALIFTVVLIFVDILAFVTDRHSSFAYIVYKHVTIAPALKRAEQFYSKQSLNLQIDEQILLAHALPRSKVWKDFIVDYNDPFSRLFDYTHVSASPKITLNRVASMTDVVPYIAQHNYAIYNSYYTFDTQTTKYLDDPFDDFIFQALYCDLQGYSPLDAALIDVTQDGIGGYADTHQLIALILRKRNNCILDNENIDQKIDAVVKRLIDAQYDEPIFSDIFAERIVLLYWSGRGDEVSPHWIQTIIDAQMGDGGWKDNYPVDTDAHVTGLAITALRYFLEGKSYQDIFVR